MYAICQITTSYSPFISDSVSSIKIREKNIRWRPLLASEFTTELNGRTMHRPFSQQVRSRQWDLCIAPPKLHTDALVYSEHASPTCGLKTGELLIAIDAPGNLLNNVSIGILGTVVIKFGTELPRNAITAHQLMWKWKSGPTVHWLELR